MLVTAPTDIRPAGHLPAQASASFDLLEALGIPYTCVSHDSADTMALCQAISDALGIVICKNLFLCNRQKTAFYLLTMAADKPFYTKELSQQIGSSRLSFATAEDMERLLHTTPGSVSILGLQFDVQREIRLLMDKAVYAAAAFGCHPCLNTASLRLKTADVLERLLPHTGHTPTVVEL